jgi:hypothetical protein
VHAGVLRLTLCIGVLCTWRHGLGAHILCCGLKAAFNAELSDTLFFVVIDADLNAVLTDKLAGGCTA